MKAKVFILILLLFLSGGLARAEEDVTFLASFRANPLSFASLTGLSVEELLARWPEALRVLLAQGMSAPPEDERLQIVASLRAERIFEEGWPLPPEFEASLPEELQEAGYPVLMAEEALAVLAFENPLPEEVVREILLQQLMVSALLNEPEGAPLLFPCWDAVGMSLRFGELRIGDEFYHAAVLVIVFAVSENSSPKVVGYVSQESEEGLQRLSGVPVKAFSWRGFWQTASFADGSYCLVGYEPEDITIWVEKEGLFDKSYFWYLPPSPYRLDFRLQN